MYTLEMEISLGVLFQHAVLLLSTGRILFLCLVPIPPPLDAVNMLAASLGRDLRDGLRVELWVFLLYDLPLRVLHDVGVVLAAVGEGGLLEVLAAVGVGEEKDLGHVHRVDRLTKVLLALNLQPWQLGRRKISEQCKKYSMKVLKAFFLTIVVIRPG